MLIRPITSKTPYELFKGVKPNISYFRVFGCRCFVHVNGKRNIGKFDKEVMKQYFLAIHLIVKLIEFGIRELCVLKNLFTSFFYETNFLSSEQDTGNIKIGLANLEDDENINKEQDQITIREQLIQEQTEIPDKEQLAKLFFIA